MLTHVTGEAGLNSQDKAAEILGTHVENSYEPVYKKQRTTMLCNTSLSEVTLLYYPYENDNSATFYIL